MGQGTLVNFPTELAAAIQDGFVEAQFKRGLDSQRAYALEAAREIIGMGKGVRVISTRHGRKVPKTRPISGQTVNSDMISNGITPSSFSVEQWELKLDMYADASVCNRLQEKAGVRSQSLVYAENNGIQAIQSVERIARDALHAGYMSCQSRVRTGLGASTTTKAYLDDVREFNKVVKGGEVVGVDSLNPLLVDEIDSATGLVVQTLNVTGVHFDSTYACAVDGSREPGNLSTAYQAGGISGYLNFDAATAPLDGNVLKAKDAPLMIRPNGRLHTGQLTSSDRFSVAAVQSAVAYLRANAIPPHAESGLYHVIYDAIQELQLFQDPQFQNLIAGRGTGDREIVAGRVFDLLGCRFMPTTEAIVQDPDPSHGVNQEIHRAVVTGAECLVQGVFSGIEAWAAESEGGIHYLSVSDYIAQIIRPPLDILAEIATFAWKTVLDYTCPTDVTANKNTIATASNKKRKRAVVIETAASPFV